MIIGDRVDAVEAEIKERKPHKGIKLNIVLTDMKELEGKRIAIGYEYTTTYDGVGYIKVKGEMYAEEDDKTRKKLLSEWKKGRKVPKDYMERLLNTINYTGTSHATLIARVLNYPPPLMPPRLGLAEKKKK